MIIKYILKGGNNIKIDDVIVKHEIGKGKVGTTYLALDKNNNKYAYKVEKITEQEIIDINNKSTKSPLYREIEFATTFKQYPEQFMILYDYKIINNTLVKLYSYNGIVLADIINKLNINQIYSMIIQLIYAIYLIRKEGYQNGDYHIYNICAMETNKEYITILNKQVKTFGYIYTMIDYGNIRHPKYDLTDIERQKLTNPKYNEMDRVKGFLIGMEFWNYVSNNKFIIDDFEKNYILSTKYNEMKIIKEITDNKYSQFTLFEILFPTEHQKLLLGNNYKETIKTSLKVEYGDIIYICKYIDDCLILIDYFFNKII